MEGPVQAGRGRRLDAYPPPPPHLDELGRDDRDEARGRGRCDRLGHHRLARARRPVEQHARGRVDADLRGARGEQKEGVSHPLPPSFGCRCCCCSIHLQVELRVLPRLPPLPLPASRALGATAEARRPRGPPASACPGRRCPRTARRASQSSGGRGYDTGRRGHTSAPPPRRCCRPHLHGLDRRVGLGRQDVDHGVRVPV